LYRLRAADRAQEFIFRSRVRAIALPVCRTDLFQGRRTCSADDFTLIFMVAGTVFSFASMRTVTENVSS